MIVAIKKELIQNKDEKYAEFSSNLLPGIDNIIGVRLPLLRRIAKKIAKSDWQKFIDENDNSFFELLMIEGMLIGELKVDLQKHLLLIEEFIPKINCWSICDSFCSNLKFIKQNKEIFKKFIEKYFNSKKEYELRFAFVILLTYFINDFDYVINKIKKFKNDFYYSKMAVAWCLSYCFIFHFDKTYFFVLNNQIDKWVLNKGIIKACESLRLDINQKSKLNKLRNITKKTKK